MYKKEIESKSEVIKTARAVYDRRMNVALNGKLIEEVECFLIFRVTCCC